MNIFENEVMIRNGKLLENNITSLPIVLFANVDSRSSLDVLIIFYSCY